MSKVYVGDNGTVISLDTGVSLVGATALEIKARKPSGTTVTWAGSASGTSIRYTTQAADLDMAGEWVLQAHVVTAAGAWLGEAARLNVYAPYS